MLLLIVYVLIALLFSFLCSVAEAVLLSVSEPYIALLEQQEKRSGPLLRRLKNNVNQPLAAILTLNTVAHTVGAAGAGAQAAIVFGNAYLGVASAVLTLLILVFSEIIPKTLGAVYWRQLAPLTAFSLKWLVWLLYPFVKMAEWMTQGLQHGEQAEGEGRRELLAMAQLTASRGHIEAKESRIVENMLRFEHTRVRDVMTPRLVVFSLDQTLTVKEYFYQYGQSRFTRIPVYSEDAEQIEGFVLRSDLLLAQARGNGERALSEYRRDLPTLLDSMSLSQAMDEFLRERTHIILVMNEYGSMQGIITLEDLVETLLGLEIVDEGDKTVDMQKLARQLWHRRAKSMGIDMERWNTDSD